ncbi:MAG TPA: type II secretion system minor pseudopilin GspK [Myxococcaceae bacterium]|nr:type II secretion system minor pseudopilin GspK [Myxococcaceae bacterium]
MRLRKRERGVTLLMVTVSIAILTAVAAEFAFQTRVDLELATKQRDALRAEYLAKSSIQLARLLLLFQKQLDRSTAALPGAAQGINLQLWRMAKLDCHLLQTVVPQAGQGRRPKFSTAGAGGLDDQGRIQYGGFAGCFDARIEDEQEKLNVNAMAGLQTGTGQAAIQSLYNLVSDKRFDFVYDREDANRIRANANDVLIGLKDWVDDDDTQSALNVTPLGQVTLQNGFSDEAALYSRYTPRYRPKNAWFDSLGELYLVNGVTDRFMAAFGDRLTVFPDPNAPLNVNSDDPLQIAIRVRIIADPSRPDPRLNDPAFLDGIVQKVRAAKAMMPMGLSVQDFTTIVQTAGIAVNPLVTQRQGTQGTTANSFLGDKSDTFRIVAIGNAGDVERRVTAVIRLSDPTRDGLGRVLYWRAD